MNSNHDHEDNIVEFEAPDASLEAQPDLPMSRNEIYDRMLELGGMSSTFNNSRKSSESEDSEPNRPRSGSIIVPLIQPPDPTVEQLSEPRSYDYQPLPTATSIRLLNLLPAEEPVHSIVDLFQPIHCSIEVVDLDDNPVFDALSYTWGDPLTLYDSPDEASSPDAWATQAFEIVCNGKVITVPTNLFTALVSLRRLATRDIDEELANRLKEASLDRPNHIWIDALSINQQDLDERSKQIMLMGRIFRQAKYVHVWLGGETKTSTQAMINMHNIANIKLSSASDLRLLKIDEEDACERAGIPPISIQEWIDLWAFFNRSWGKRAWVVQEVAMAKKPVMICGLKMIEFRAPVQALAVLRRSRWIHQLRIMAEPCIEGQRSKHLASTRLTSIPKEIKLYQPTPGNIYNHNFLFQMLDERSGLGIEDDKFKRREDARPEPLCRILNKYRSTESTDPRDKVYSMLGLSREFVEDCHPHGKLVPNYKLSVREVYIETAKYILASTGRLELLSVVQDELLTREQGLPSWVPDFSAECFPTPLDDGRPMPWTASAGIGPAHIEYPSNDLLEVRGLTVGTVVEAAGWTKDRLGALRMLQQLPEVSEVRDPVLNDRVRNYLEKDEIEEWVLKRELPESPPNTSGAVRTQSRFEVFWRTVLTDCFKGQHPAPEELAVGFRAELERDVKGEELTALNNFLNGDPVSWSAARGYVALIYSAINNLLGNAVDNVDSCSYPPEFQRFLDTLDAIGEEDEDGTQLIMEAGMVLFNEITKDEGHTILKMEIDNKLAVFQSMRQLFRMDCGRLGTGPMSMKAGDQVWVLAGGFIPFVLRPLENGCYKLVGEAYVHGIMHGEAVPEEASLKQQLKTIVIE